MNNDSKEKYQLTLKILKPFAAKNLVKARAQVFLAFISIAGFTTGSYFLYDINPWLTIIPSVFLTAFISHCFVILHDCGHQSMFRSRIVNSIVGNIFGFLSLIPYEMWRYIHYNHHNNVGNLDRRHLNPDLWTMTVKEYEASNRIKQLIYRHLRSHTSRLIFTPFVLPILFRIPSPKQDRASMISVIVYDILYVIVFYFILQVMPLTKLLVIYGIPLYLFWFLAGLILYAQHQFEDTYWEREENWSYEEATLIGSSYLTSPKWFTWMSGSVGYHNVHHLVSSIPNYNLKEAHIAIEKIHSFKPISIFRVLRLLKYKIWDEDKKKLVPFPKKNRSDKK